MLRNTVYALAAVAVFAAAGMSSAAAAGPGNGWIAMLGAGPSAEPVSNWGEPYPYGYRWRKGCLRHVAEETPWGREWHVVWVCRPVR